MLRDVVERTNTSDQDRRGLPGRDTRTRGRARPHRADRALPDDSVHRTGLGAGAHSRDQQVRLSDPTVSRRDRGDLHLHNRYKTALRSFYAKHGAAMVTFEVARVSSKGGHAHVQVVPVPETLADKVGEAFVNEGKRIGLEPESDAQEALVACGDGKKSYFRLDLPDGKIMIWLFDGAGRSFSLQFGRYHHPFFFFLSGELITVVRRIVLTSLLGMKDRLDWKACAQSDEDDTEDANEFKAAFAPFEESPE